MIFKLMLNFKTFIKSYYINKYQTTMHFTQARKYSNYLKLNQKKFSLPDYSPKHKLVAHEFKKTGASFYSDKVTASIGKSILKKIKNNKELKWNINKESNKINLSSEVLTSFPELKELIHEVIEPVVSNVFKSNYKIFFAVMFKSKHFSNKAIGSALWHTDGAPGTCINVMFYPQGVQKKQGALRFISWESSRKLIIKCDKFVKSKFKKPEDISNKNLIRTAKAKFYENEILNDKEIIVNQPTSKTGSVLFFRNNCIHKGGHPEKNHERLAIIFNIYPHEDKPDYDDWFKRGRQKTSNYPKIPNF